MNTTILSGEIGGPGISDNSYHVMVIPDFITNASLDDITIEHGNANGPGDLEDHGAGVLCLGVFDMTHVKIRNCIATAGGNSIYNKGTKAMLSIELCDFYDNGTENSVINVESAKFIVRDLNSIDD